MIFKPLPCPLSVTVSVSLVVCSSVNVQWPAEFTICLLSVFLQRQQICLVVEKWRVESCEINRGRIVQREKKGLCWKQHPCLGAREGVRGQWECRMAQSSPADTIRSGKMLRQTPNKWLSVWGFSVCVCLTFFFSISSECGWCDSSVPNMPLSLCLAWKNKLNIFCLVEYLTLAFSYVGFHHFCLVYFYWLHCMRHWHAWYSCSWL